MGAARPPPTSPRLFADLMADDTADRGSADGSNGAAIRQDGTRDAADTGSGHRAPALFRHPATAAHADEQGYGYRTTCQSLNRIH